MHEHDPGAQAPHVPLCGMALGVPCTSYSVRWYSPEPCGEDALPGDPLNCSAPALAWAFPFSLRHS